MRKGWNTQNARRLLKTLTDRNTMKQRIKSERVFLDQNRKRWQ